MENKVQGKWVLRKYTNIETLFYQDSSGQRWQFLE